MVFISTYLAIIFLVVEICVILMRLTGLDREISRFQVVSMLTGTGFTTKESELILRHPARRKIGIFLILFGVFSLAVIISSLSTMISEHLKGQETIWITIMLAILWVCLRIPKLQRKLAGFFEHKIVEHFDLHEVAVREVLFLDEDDWLVDVPLFEGSEWIGLKPEDMLAEEDDVQLLFIHRGERKIRGKRMTEILAEGDILYMYGNRFEIGVRFERDLHRKEQLLENDKGAAAIL
ncbi:potassium transporter TrkA [Paenibacillus gansuensis]|uniref:Potassium transporter TrkA n=1 Tax=Paenibacillus gansuensis TaxID=306542 RepID=A0ABW5PDX1_9BACL